MVNFSTEMVVVRGGGGGTGLRWIIQPKWESEGLGTKAVGYNVANSRIFLLSNILQK